jgi:hypothetical protein
MDKNANADRPASTIEISLSEFDAIRSRQERLRDSVEDLQKQMAEKKKPWYRQATTLMSVAGTLFAVLSGLYSIHSARTQDVSKNAAELNTIISEVIQIHADELQDASSAKSDFVGYSTRSQLRNTRRLALLEEADSKINAASNQVSPSLLIVLATEADGDGEYTTARKYLLLAIQRSQTLSPERVAALFTLAQFCLFDGKALCKPNEGDSSYRAALAQQPNNSDSTRYQRGQLLAKIALLVHYAHSDDTLANDYFNQADSEVAQMSSSNPVRQQLAQFITTTRASIASPTPTQSASFSTPETFIGRWSITFAEDSTRSGTVTFVSLPTYPFYGAYVDIFQDNKLIEKQTGQVAVLDPRTLRLDWTSVGVSGQSLGYSKIILTAKGRALKGEQHRLGEVSSEFSMQR